MRGTMPGDGARGDMLLVDAVCRVVGAVGVWCEVGEVAAEVESGPVRPFPRARTAGVLNQATSQRGNR